MKKILILTLTILSVAVVASPYVKPTSPSGVVVFSYEAIGDSQGERVLPVSLFEIDGENVLKRSSPVWLSPGKHTLVVKVNGTGQVLGSNRFKRTQIANSRMQNTVEFTVEDGKFYYVGYDARERNPKKWKAIVWRNGDLKQR